VLRGVVDQESAQVTHQLAPIGTAGQHTSLHCRLLVRPFAASFISIQLLFTSKQDQLTQRKQKPNITKKIF